MIHIDNIYVYYRGNLYQFGRISPSLIDVALTGASFVYCFLPWVKEGGEYVEQYSIYEYVRHIDSVSLANHTYKDVRETKYSFVMINNDTYDVSFYASRSIGLIQIIKGINGIDTTWTLLRYHAIQ